MKIISSELIPVYETDQGNKAVNARELHEFLGVATRYNDWIKARIEKYGFVDGEDFTAVTENLVSGGRQTIHILKLETAKELCMVENNEQGRKARKYFIEIEKRYKAQVVDVSKLSPEMQMFNQMFNAVAKMQLDQAETKKELAEMKSAVTTIQETFLGRDEDWRKSINAKLNAAAFRLDGNYRELRTKSYEILEARGRCNLDIRLRNLIERLEEAGATKTQLKNTTRMDVIESDPRLKEIYTTIVKELSIGSLQVRTS
jgi:anti-repressor protein